MSNYYTSLSFLLSLSLVALGFTKAEQPANTPEGPATKATQGIADTDADGWIPLFDGTSTNGWHIYRKDYVSSAWKVEDGALVFDKSSGEEGGDLVTDLEFENYDLRLEWKISPCGNSGIIFNAHESSQYRYPWQTGPEMQILDNACHPDAKIITHRAGDLYDMIACKTETVLPANTWNRVRIKVKNGKAQFWLNGKKVVKFTMFNDEWKNRIANSKFKTMSGFGTFRKGRIVLQDHGDKVWFRNIKIKNL